MRVQKRFSHESHTADQTLVRLFVAMNKSMRVSIVATVESFSTYLQPNKPITN